MPDDTEITAATLPPEVRQKAHLPSPAGRANFPQIIEKIAISPSQRPSLDDCYSTLLHNPDSDQGLTVSDCSGNTARDCLFADADADADTGKLSKVR